MVTEKLKIGIVGDGGELGHFLKNSLKKSFKVVGNGKHKLDSNQKLKLYNQIFSNSNSILLCAGRTRYRCKNKEHLKEHKNLIFYYLKLIKAISPKFVIFLSSTAVYGEHLEHRQVKESKKPYPFTIYSKNKFIAEKKLKRLCFKKKIKLCILRLPIVWDKKTNPKFPTPQLLINRIKNKSGLIKIPASLVPPRNYLRKEKFGFLVKKILTKRPNGVFNLVPDFSASPVDVLLKGCILNKIVLEVNKFYPLPQSFCNQKIKKALKIKKIESKF